MTKTDSSAISELKTLGFTPLIYCSDQALFNVRAGVPIVDALSQASDLLFLAKSFTEDAAYVKDTDRHAWAAHYLTAMSKAVIDDVVKVLTPRPARTKTESEEELPESK
ncbi:MULTISPECIES: DUF3077 domain-containing protein [Pseudomonas]|uniref:DUF3077 domain-containing protein n=1 Tax=Pseudomonas frederiksbergensis TaxID=104087 RepID=A0A2S8HTZ3_9PSED|nr:MULTISPECIES: DUF3077 domain-containing protein [Pseudomonas]PQP06030.1 hypothetical protein C5612_05175 [Pseudomonas frederiksbergensis]WLG52070.1 DUF3077 domain-containing protein [Pseudomonas sp. FP1742]